ncbi:phosphodiesterase [Natronococcus pandeyae]|uniref:Phosphodiesterase n=1 Tax=Natronococcus pandeyae TaxID=2055836 RepID=A0A8J8Q2H8_9EURY|nr:alkaline phosphatase family protein [Natronococcus pandeyae]TYL38945.1 phosphodiesterase [Natronococcus pandeyae]
MAHNVLLVGIDAGDFRTIDPLIEKGAMPTVESLLEEGYDATLESSIPPWTPTAWTSMTSGKNPGKHGVFDFKTPDGERLVDTHDVRTSRIWDYLTEAGSRSIVVNVPVTDPAPEIDGIVIPGFLGREVDRAEAHPDGILDELRDAIGEYSVYPDGSLEGEALCDEYVRTMRTRRDAIEYLCTTHEWDFAMVEFQVTDLVFHELPDDRHIERVYRKLDEFIADVIGAVEADTVLLASDHGMGTMGEWDVRVNTWLKRRGFLETSVDGREYGWSKPGAETGRREGIVAQLARELSRIGLTPQRIEAGLAAVGVATLAKRVLPDSVLEQAIVAGEKIDEESSSAYFPSSSGLGIYCDDDVQETIIDGLSAMTIPGETEPVFERVLPAAEVFDGPYASNGPDVVVVPNGFEYFVSATVSSSVFDRARYRFNHKPEGMLIASGPTVEETTERRSNAIYDVAPTVLGLMGIPLDTGFDGERIAEIAPEPSTAKEYSHRSSARRSEERPEVRSRLEDLGYFD